MRIIRSEIAVPICVSFAVYWLEMEASRSRRSDQDVSSEKRVIDNFPIVDYRHIADRRPDYGTCGINNCVI